MRKYVIIGSVVVLVLGAVTVFALQGKSGQPSAVAREVAPLPASNGSSGCGAGGTDCASVASGGCNTSSGGCGGEALNPDEAKRRNDQITAYLQDYYRTKLGYDAVQVTIDDYGCHQEATVTQAGQIIDKLSISGNRITKLEG